MNKRYTISFRYTKRGERKPGPVQRFVIYAGSLAEAKEQTKRYANYPNVQIISVKEA